MTTDQNHVINTAHATIKDIAWERDRLKEENEKLRVVLHREGFRNLTDPDGYTKEPATPQPLRVQIKSIVLKAFNDSGRNYRKTADILGIPKSTAHDWIKRWETEL